MNSFKNFQLLPTLAATLAEKKLEQPTEIQRKALPLLLAGKSVVGVSETGSGKTLAYALPILQILKDLENKGAKITEDSQPRAIVIVPTRELGEQVSKVFKPFTHTTRLRVRTALGGTTFEVAKRNVSGPFEVLIATMGRLTQLIERKLIQVTDLKILVFDEADQMLDPGFLPEARRIVSLCPPDRQMILFSATVNASVQTLMKELFKSVEVIRSQGSHRVPAGLKTIHRSIKDGKRYPVLEELLAKDIEGGTLIFVNTREQCDRLAIELAKGPRKFLIYRGEMDKVQRRNNLKKFRSGEVRILVATDVASRGLDIDHVGRVINYHMPKQMDAYIHRVGRTARAGRKGLVVNFVTERDIDFVKQLDTIAAAAPITKG